ncbi:transcriptional repressor (plasmid) [Microvirga sp. VF16]|nr:transcriptional repressor [Microvirga sp. VF16]
MTARRTKHSGPGTPGDRIETNRRTHARAGGSREPAALSGANRIEAQCRAKGMRLTDQRRLIAHVLSEAEDHPDVFELHRRVVAQCPHVALATVYRTVRRLEAEGILERHEFRDGHARYEPASKTHHDHLIDLETGNVVEFRNAEIERLQAEIARRLGYRLVSHRLELYALPVPVIPRSDEDRS